MKRKLNSAPLKAKGAAPAKFSRVIRMAVAIAVALACGGLLRAQDANSAWLLRGPQISSAHFFDISSTRVDLARLQSQPSNSQTPASSDNGADTRPAPTLAPRPATSRSHGGSDAHRFWDTTNVLLF